MFLWLLLLSGNMQYMYLLDHLFIMLVVWWSPPLGPAYFNAPAFAPPRSS